MERLSCVTVNCWLANAAIAHRLEPAVPARRAWPLRAIRVRQIPSSTATANSSDFDSALRCPRGRYSGIALAAR